MIYIVENKELQGMIQECVLHSRQGLKIIVVAIHYCDSLILLWLTIWKDNIRVMYLTTACSFLVMTFMN